MTFLQKSNLYGPASAAMLKACWVFEGGRQMPRPGRPSALPDSGLPRPEDVEELAARIAQRDGRPRHTADDLKRAACWLALGRDVPDRAKLTRQADISRVLNAFRLLANPDNLEEVAKWLNPEREARRNEIFAIERRSGFAEKQLRQWSAYFNDGAAEWRELGDAQFAAFRRYVWQEAKGRKNEKLTA